MRFSDSAGRGGQVAQGKVNVRSVAPLVEMDRHAELFAVGEHPRAAHLGVSGNLLLFIVSPMSVQFVQVEVDDLLKTVIRFTRDAGEIVRIQFLERTEAVALGKVRLGEDRPGIKRDVL